MKLLKLLITKIAKPDFFWFPYQMTTLTTFYPKHEYTDLRTRSLCILSRR